MIINRSPYSNGKVQVLFQYLRNAHTKGKPIEYEIRVDDLKVVNRTSNLEEFDDYEEFVTEDTRAVSFIFYEGQSRRSVRHVLELNRREDPKESKELKEIRQLRQELSGLQDRKSSGDPLGLGTIDFDEKLKNYRRDWDYEELQKKYGEQEKILEQSQKEITELEKENVYLIEQIREVKKQWETAEESSAFKNVFPKLLEDILKGKDQSIVLSGLSSLGIFGGGEKDKATLNGTQNIAPEGNATFKKKESPGGEASFSEVPPTSENKPEPNQKEKQYIISEEDKSILDAMKATLGSCNRQQVDDLTSFLVYVAHDPSVTKAALESSESLLRQKQQSENQDQSKNV